MGWIEGRWQIKPSPSLRSVQSAMFQDELEKYLQARNTMALGKSNIIKETKVCLSMEIRKFPSNTKEE